MYCNAQAQVSMSSYWAERQLSSSAFNLKLSPQVGEWGGSHALGLAPPLLVSHSHPGPMNKEGFVQRMNGDSFLLGILLKLESRGLLPLMTTKGSRQPNLRTQLVSNSHLAAAEA